MDSDINEISFLGTFPPTKGISPYCMGLVRGLRENCMIHFFGFKSIYPNFLYPGGTREEGVERPKLDNVRFYEIISWYNPFSWIVAGSKLKGKILHAQWWTSVLAPIYLVIFLWAKIKGMKIILTIHNVTQHERTLLSRMFDPVVVRCADGFIVHSESNKKTFSHLYSIPNEKISVISHGILLPERSEKVITKKDAREFFGISESRKVLLSFGNIREYKAIDILLLSLRELLKKDDSYHLIIAGEPWIEWAKYQKLIDMYDLGKHVKLYLDFIKTGDVEKFFVASDLMMLTYRDFESQSGAGALSLGFNLPALVSNQGGLTDFAVSPDLIVKEISAEEIAKKIVFFFENRLRFSHGLDHIKKNFQWADIAKKTLSVYQNVI